MPVPVSFECVIQVEIFNHFQRFSTKANVAHDHEVWMRPQISKCTTE
jgi:hypothetical protein